MALYTLDKANINAISGSMAHDLDRLILRIQQHKAWMDTITDAQLLAVGYVQGDIDILRSGMGDMDQLRSIYQGATDLAVAKDFRTFTKLMYPFGSLT